MSIDYRYNPLSEIGSLLPNIRSVADKTFFVKRGEYKELWMANDGDWTKFNLTPNDDAKFKSLTVDEFFANKFIYRQINAFNGDQIFSDTGEVEEVNGNVVRIKDNSGFNVCSFQPDDLIITKQVNPSDVSQIRYVKATVDNVIGNEIEVVYTSTDVFQKGDTIIRVGSTSDTSRQDSIFISTNEANTPYIDVYDNITGFTGTGSAYWDNHIPEVRIGKLTGITDADFGALSGYGIYAQNAYFKGNILIDNPEDNGINTTYRQPSAPTGDLKVNDIWIDSDDSFKIYTWDGSSWISGIPGIGTSLSGLNITGSYMGYYNGTGWKTYMGNNGDFYLLGADPNWATSTGYLAWFHDINTLAIKGSIRITNPSTFNDGNKLNTSDLNNDSGWGGGNTTSQGTTFPTSPNANDLHWYTKDPPDSPYKYLQWYRYTGSAWEEIGSTGTYIDPTGIYTGNVAANQIVAGTGIVNSLSVFSTLTMGGATTDGTIQSYGWNGTVNGFQIKGGATPSISIIGGAFTGGTIQTAPSGQRVVIDSTNTISFFNDTTLTSIGSIYGGFSSPIDSLQITTPGVLELNGDIYVRANKLVVSDSISIGDFLVDENGLLTLDGFQAMARGDNISHLNNDSGFIASVFYPIEDDKFVKYDSATGKIVGTAYNENSFLTSLPSHGNEAHTSTFLTSSDINASDWDEAWAWVETNGSTAVFTSGSYSNPTWITQLADSKIHTGSGGNNVAYFNGSGNLSLGSISSPLSISSGTISIPVATSSANGYLSSTDWSTFNGKQSAITVSAESSSDIFAATSSGGSPTTNLDYVTITINGTPYNVLLKP